MAAAADDGYAIYACLTACGMREQKMPRGRCVIMIEAWRNQR